MMEFSSYSGAVQVGEGLWLPAIWAALHMTADVTAKFEHDPRYAPELKRMLEGDLFQLQSLKKVRVEEWSQLCSAAGWTVYGAVGLSWCQSATLPMVGQAWQSNGEALKLTSGFQRAARLVNPAILPAERRLSLIDACAENDPTSLCIALASSDEGVEWDLPVSLLRQAPPNVAAFLLHELRKVGRPDADQQHLAELWGELLGPARGDRAMRRAGAS